MNFSYSYVLYSQLVCSMNSPETYSFKAQLERFEDSPLWSYFIRIPDELAQELLKTGRRLKITLNNKLDLQLAMMASGEGFQFINMNKDVRNKLKLEEGDEVHVLLRADHSEYGIYVPDFFTLLCEQDPEANALFHALTPGKQRSLLHIIGKFKSEEKQLEKALVIFEYLKSTLGELDFKELNEAFKANKKRLQ